MFVTNYLDSYRKLDSGFLRSPLLKSDVLISILKDNSIENLLYIYENNEVLKCAIAVASPQFSDYIDKRKDKLNLSAREKDKIRNSLYKYIMRASYRCTPYGLFSSLGSFDCIEKDSEKIATEKLSYEYRFDGEFYFSVIQEYKNSLLLINHSKYFSNNTIYKVGNELRYFDKKILGNLWKHNIASIDYSFEIEQLIKFCLNGKYFSEIYSFILELIPEFSENEAVEFFHILIDNFLIVNYYELNFDIDSLISILKSHKSIYSDFNYDYILSILSSDLSKVDSYDSLKLLLKDLKLFKKGINYLQVNLIDENISSVKELKDCSDFTSALNFLISTNDLKYNSNLKKFKDKFFEKFEHKKVPILEALDPDSGVGYPYGADFDDKEVDLLLGHIDPTVIKSESVLLDDYHSFLNEKLINNKGSYFLNIYSSDQDFLTFSEKKLNQIPSSFSVLGDIYNNGQEKTLCISSILGYSASNLLSRFYEDSDKIETIVKDVFNYEKKIVDDFLLAEINHISIPRGFNISKKPDFRDFSINILTSSPTSTNLPLSDISVYIDLDNNIRLWSHKFCKNIQVRFSSAFAFNNNTIPVFKFLGDLQGQNTQHSYSFNWKSFLNHKFLPRVVFNDFIVLSKATWNFNISSIDVNDNKYLEELSRVFNDHSLPDYFTFGVDDQELLFEKGCNFSFNIFKKISIRNKIFSFSFKEVLSNFNAPFFSKNEFVLSYVNSNSHVKNDYVYRYQHSNFSDIARSFKIGDSWIFFTIYGSYNSLNGFLISLHEFKLKHNSDLFFIRYMDHIGNHIRLRIKTTDYYRDLPLFASFLNEFPSINFVLNSYSRELERYGGNIELVESIFCLDSSFILNYISFKDKHDISDDFDFLFATTLIQSYLNCFNYSIEKRINLFNTILNNYSDSLGSLKFNYFDFINKKYKVYTSLNNQSENFNFFNFIHNISIDFEESIRPIISNLDTKDLDYLLPHILHMFSNRLFSSHSRKSELLVYGFLHKISLKSKYLNIKKIDLLQ